MSGFDRIARAYRWMEYLSFGRSLEACRFRFLPRLRGARHALLLGDGDGRFAARLLKVAMAVEMEAVDASEGMLARLRGRCAAAGGSGRVTTHRAEMPRGLPLRGLQMPCDLVTTHFFLDCLSTAEVEELVWRVSPMLTDDAVWVVSEFAIPARGRMRGPARVVVRLLYVAFGLMAGLRARKLPQYTESLGGAGFVLEARETSLGGLLVAELWRRAAGAHGPSSGRPLRIEGAP